MKNFDLEYPRPQFKRENWLNLNGLWSFLFDDENVGEKGEFYAEFPCAKAIYVPFTYETKMSGVGDETAHRAVWYNRKFSLSDEDVNEGILLHFEGSDFYTKVWINGKFVGENIGGYHRFSFDITNFVNVGNNDITVKVEDSLSLEQPRGKQRYRTENFACWYVQTTGIWKTVWIERAGDKRFNHVKITTNYDNKSVRFDYDLSLVGSQLAQNQCFAKTIISFEGRTIFETRTKLNPGANG